MCLKYWWTSFLEIWILFLSISPKSYLFPNKTILKSLLFVKLCLINSIKVLEYSNDSLSFKANNINTDITPSNSFWKIFVVENFSSSVNSFIVNILLSFSKFDFLMPISEGEIFSSNCFENNKLKKLVFPTPFPPNIYILFCSLVL